MLNKQESFFNLSEISTETAIERKYMIFVETSHFTSSKTAFRAQAFEWTVKLLSTYENLSEIENESVAKDVISAIIDTIKSPGTSTSLNEELLHQKDEIIRNLFHSF